MQRHEDVVTLTKLSDCTLYARRVYLSGDVSLQNATIVADHVVREIGPGDLRLTMRDSRIEARSISLWTQSVILENSQLAGGGSLTQFHSVFADEGPVGSLIINTRFEGVGVTLDTLNTGSRGVYIESSNVFIQHTSPAALDDVEVHAKWLTIGVDKVPQGREIPALLSEPLIRGSSTYVVIGSHELVRANLDTMLSGLEMEPELASIEIGAWVDASAELASRVKAAQPPVMVEKLDCSGRSNAAIAEGDWLNVTLDPTWPREYLVAGTRPLSGPWPGISYEMDGHGNEFLIMPHCTAFCEKGQRGDVEQSSVLVALDETVAACGILDSQITHWTPVFLPIDVGNKACVPVPST